MRRRGHHHFRATVRESWDRLTATACTFAAGIFAAVTPSPSIDQLLGGFPATLSLGGLLALGAALNVLGLAWPSFLWQRVGIIIQVTMLALFVVALALVARGSALAYALLLVALAFRLVSQFRLTGKTREFVAAVKSSET